MLISFATNRLERQLASAGSIQRAFGDRAKRLQMRLDVLYEAECLAEVPAVPPTRRHELTGDRKGHFAVDVTGNLRIILRPSDDQVPLKEDGSIDLSSVTSILIVEVTDYH